MTEVEAAPLRSLRIKAPSDIVTVVGRRVAYNVFIPLLDNIYSLIVNPLYISLLERASAVVHHIRQIRLGN